MNRAARVAWPALTFLLAIVVALPVVAALGGGLDGLVVGRVLSRLVLDAAVAAVLGIVLMVLLALPADDERRGGLLDVAAGAAALWAVTAATTAFLLYLSQAPAFSNPNFGPGLVAFVADVDLGRTWVVAAVLAAVLTAALVAARSSAGVAVIGAVAVLALVPVALLAAMAGDPLGLARAVFGAELVQLVGGGAWIGLVALGTVLHLPAATVRRIAGLACVSGSAALVAALLGVGPRLEEGASPGSVLPAIVLAAGALVLCVVARARGRRLLLRGALLLLAATAGLTTAAEVGQRMAARLPARTTPAEILTGAPLPAAPSPTALLLGGRPDALWLVICVALLVAYLAGVGALRRRGAAWPVGRSVAWIVGVVALGWLTSGGPAAYQEVLMSAHLAQHAALLLPVPLLLAAGAPRRLLEGVGDVRAATLRAGVLAASRSSFVRALARPVPATALAVAACTALYGTGLLGWSLTDPLGAECAVAIPLVAGGLLVSALTAARRTAAAVTAVVLLVIETAAAAALALGSGLLLSAWFGAMGWGTDALVDQRTGVVLAWALLVVPTVVLLVAGLRRPGSATARTRDPVVTRPQEEVPA